MGSPVLAHPSSVDPLEFSHFPKVMFRHERMSQRRLARVETPTMVARLTDWLYANVLHGPGPDLAPEGHRRVDTLIRLEAYVNGRMYHPWEFVPTGATVVYRRLPFSDSQFDLPAWEPQRDAILGDQHIIESFIHHQGLSMEYSRLYRHIGQRRQEQVESLAQPQGARLYRCTRGIARENLKQAVTAEEIDRAMIGPDGQLVVPKNDPALFDAVVGRNSGVKLLGC